ncbi:hypothetical protein ASD89_20790 [Caulobacter sp. Root656]|nr:hypothetical protein ASD89_20790 [Caulobacter sp. Root656]
METATTVKTSTGTGQALSRMAGSRRTPDRARAAPSSKPSARVSVPLYRRSAPAPFHVRKPRQAARASITPISTIAYRR